MAITRITRYLSLHRSKTFFTSFFAVILTFSTVSNADASRNGVLKPENPYAIGFTFNLDGAQHICSGALISPTFIVTAAHCVVNSKGEQSTDYFFTAPGVALDAPVDLAIRQPKAIKAYLPPGFVLTEDGDNFDIAFIQLDIPLATKGFIKVATSADLESVNSSYPLKGYGIGAVYETGVHYSQFAREYSLLWNKAKNAQNTVQLNSTDSVSCTGDSGGPIVLTKTDGTELLIGVMSGAARVVDHCGTKDASGNYTMKVTYAYPYVNLVESILNTPVATMSPKPSTSPKPTPTSKPKPANYKITCVKGKTKKYVTGTNPKCPFGYKQTAKARIS
jgi:V8-like Glu-specific endopeptidase